MSQFGKGLRRRAAGQVDAQPLELQLAALATLTRSALRKAWVGRFGMQPPDVRTRHILLQEFAWRVQAETLGGLDAVTERKLREIAAALERDGAYEPKVRRDLSPGVVLTREWKGVIHKVTATRDGFQHQGRQYRSLSDIARTITGTRWSGPRFFGLEQKRKRTSRGAKA
jgi:DUF2924 family protein